MTWQLELAPSAFRHGTDEDDIRHAFANSMVIYKIEREGPSRFLHFGPDRAGNLLKLVVVEIDTPEWLVIHGMKMRPKFESMLRGADD
jgi:hypothetical protein